MIKRNLQPVKSQSPRNASWTLQPPHRCSDPDHCSHPGAEGLITLVVPKNTTGIVISYLTMLIAAIFSTLLQTGYDYLLLNMARGKQAQLKDLIYPFQTMPDHVIPACSVSAKPGLHAFRLQVSSSSHCFTSF